MNLPIRRIQDRMGVTRPVTGSKALNTDPDEIP